MPDLPLVGLHLAQEVWAGPHLPQEVQEEPHLLQKVGRGCHRHPQ